jgi:hypothetical protein
VVATPEGRPRILDLIAAAQEDSVRTIGRGLTREELTRVLSQYPDTGEAVSPPRPQVAAREEPQMTTEPSPPDGDLDDQWIALYDAGDLIGRSYATVRKWVSGEQPKLKVEQHPTDRRAVIVRVSDLLRVHAQEDRKGLRRTVRVLTRADGRAFTVWSQGEDWVGTAGSGLVMRASPCSLTLSSIPRLRVEVKHDQRVVGAIPLRHSRRRCPAQGEVIVSAPGC